MLLKALLTPIALIVVSYLAHVEYLYQYGTWNRALEWLPQACLLVALAFSVQYNQLRIAILILLATLQLPDFSQWLQSFNVQQTGKAPVQIFIVCLAAIITLILPNKSLRHWLAWVLVVIGISPVVGAAAFMHIQPELTANLLSTIHAASLPSPFYSYVVIGLLLLSISATLLACWRYRQSQEAVAIALVCATWLSTLLVDNKQLYVLCYLAVAICAMLFVFQHAYRLAYYDELTGLPSRRALNQYASSLGRNYIVVMSDVDHFKKFNDTYGHDVGDQVLKLVASRLNQVGKGGRVNRYGGEEFTLVFKGHNETKVVAELEKLRQSIADYDMVVRDKTRTNQSKKDRKTNQSAGKQVVNVTISLGYCVSSKAQGGFDACLKAADEALYRAKKAGRNCVSD